MQELNIYNPKNQMFVGTVQVADTFYTRLRGLLGSKSLASFKGLLIKPCKQVHTIGMNYSISVWYINKELQIIKIIDELPPNRFSSYIRQTSFIIEFPSSWAKITESCVGDKLQFVFSDSKSDYFRAFYVRIVLLLRKIMVFKK